MGIAEAYGLLLKRKSERLVFVVSVREEETLKVQNTHKEILNGGIWQLSQWCPVKNSGVMFWREWILDAPSIISWRDDSNSFREELPFWGRSRSR